ncbi:MAG: hypothetical protein ACT6U0_15765 [Shinella sp.]|uniref:hypothetical protein n=1 Tax=Shinella sp. TaxID=1870904 RepID=UPI004035CCD6
MNMLVLLTHLSDAAKQYERQIVHCENRLSGNAISTLSMKLQATFEGAFLDAEGASFMPGLAFSTRTAD